MKAKNDSSKLTGYLLKLDGEYFPSSILLDQAIAIQLNDGTEYTLDDAKIF